jgi:hypothetical protein
MFWRNILLHGGSGQSKETSLICKRTGGTRSWRTGVMAIWNLGWGNGDETG